MALRTATSRELDRLWPAVRAAGVFADREDLARFHEHGPWRVQVDEGGRAVVLERWRAHLAVCAVRGIWCGPSEIPRLVSQAVAVAAAHDLPVLLSPLIAEEAAGAYRRAGMRIHERLVAYRVRLSDRRSAREAVGGLDLRTGSERDVDDVLAVDATCFDDFWRYGRPELRRAFERQRLALAHLGGSCVGYTLSTVSAGGGSIGRLAVVPEERGQGIGQALIADALDYLGRSGCATVTLCTQDHNDVSRRLYARAGMAKLPGTLVFMATGSPTDPAAVPKRH